MKLEQATATLPGETSEPRQNTGVSTDPAKLYDHLRLYVTPQRGPHCFMGSRGHPEMLDLDNEANESVPHSLLP